MGGDPDRFWRLTPRETQREFEAMGRKAENEHRARAWLAWNTATMPNWRKIPSLADFLQIKKSAPRIAPRQSADVQLAQMKAIHVAFGGNPDDFKKVH